MSYDSWKTTPPDYDDDEPRDDEDPEPEIEPDDPDDPGAAATDDEIA